MADAVTSQTLVNGSKHLAMKFTNLSDGTGEAAVKKVDATALNSGADIKIMKIHYCVQGMVATLLWDATAAIRIVDLAGDGVLDFSHFGGLINNAGDGKTGDILLTTTGHTAGDLYSIVLEMQKS